MVFHQKGRFVVNKQNVFLAFVIVFLAASCEKGSPTTPEAPKKATYTIAVSSAVCGYSQSKKMYILSFLVEVKNTNAIGGKISSWIAKVKSGSTLLLEFHEGNCANYGFKPDAGNPSISANGTGSIDLIQDGWHSLTSMPSIIEVSVVVTDNNNYTQTLTAQKEFIIATFS